MRSMKLDTYCSFSPFRGGIEIRNYYYKLQTHVCKQAIIEILPSNTINRNCNDRILILTMCSGTKEKSMDNFLIVLLPGNLRNLGRKFVMSFSCRSDFHTALCTDLVLSTPTSASLVCCQTFINN